MLFVMQPHLCLQATKQASRDRSVRPSVLPALKGHKVASPEQALPPPPPPRPQQDALELPHALVEPALSLPSPPPTPAIPPGPSTSRAANPPQSTLTPPPSSPAPSPSSPSADVVSTSQFRVLIAKMREEGRLAPPPTIEYVLRATDKANAPEPVPLSLSSDSELDGVDAMAIDEHTEPESAARSETQPTEEDPHNIDDLYGDVAPRFRSRPAPPPAPAPPVRERSAPRVPLTRLPYMERDKRPMRDGDIELIFEKMERIEDQRGELSRRPRKCVATRLAGKALKKKQRTVLNYCSLDDLPVDVAS
ncbi:hypothetical protein C8T65DRAFT_289772 [Cerioporus squamosus]|nr:hypothetical protein C8T65DRAFT_289772 [Cerioporus squamosus]